MFASNYRNSESIYSFEVLTTVRKNFILRVSGYLDLPLVIEKIDLSVKFLLRDCQRNGQNIKFGVGKEFACRGF